MFKKHSKCWGGRGGGWGVGWGILKMFFKNIFRFFLYVCLLIYTYIYVSIYACHVYCQALVLVNEEEKFCRKSVLENDFIFRKNNKKIEMCKMTF